MTKLIAFAALAGLLAVSCASQNGQGGSSDQQVPANYGSWARPGISTNPYNPAASATPDPNINPAPSPTDSTTKSQNP